MAGGDAIAREALEDLTARGLLRSLEPLRGRPGVEIQLASGERLVSFSSNDYLGLAAHPTVAAALAAGALAHGSGASASRLVVGHFDVHAALEEELARFEGCAAATLFGSGYAANCGSLPVFVGAGDVLLSDALNHASLIDAARLSRARVEIYRHADPDDLEAQLVRARRGGARRVLVATDTVFSMDGDVAPLADLAAVCTRHDALLAVDEAHATGVLGPRGSGLTAALDLGAQVDLRMATLSKAAGVVGAYVSGSRAICDLLVNRARTLVFSTGLPPAIACAARTAIQLLAGPEGDARRIRLWRNVERFAAGLRALGLPAQPQSAIFPVVLGTPERALAAAATLRQHGLLVKPIRPPTVPAGTSRLRFALSADHSAEQLDRALGALREIV